ncbi:MAG: tetratricopeptide repeat protein, partial [Akkermansiaceae bacterium]|nr:tetratricopeptide repeat protein [Verrucomicrobiales bacterium]
MIRSELKRPNVAPQIIAVSLALVFLGPGCRQVDHAPLPAKVETPAPRLQATAPVDEGARQLWQELMNNASGAMSQKSFAEAQLNCAEAWKIASQFPRTDPCLITNMVLMAQIYQAENKFDAAEHTFKEAISFREKLVGTNDPSLVMPLESLANFYYFAQHRYDLATPLCLRILKLVENASPPD